MAKIQNVHYTILLQFSCKKSCLRGIDIAAVNLVVSYEIPYMRTDNLYDKEEIVDGETYMRNVAQASRFGTKGVCMNLTYTDYKTQYKLLKP